MSARICRLKANIHGTVASVLLRSTAVKPLSALARHRYEIIGGLLIVALYLVHAAIFGRYIADDAGISLAYARNIVAGFGPVLYPGGEAVEGYSNPLWVALLGVGAAIHLDGADGVPMMKTLGLAFGAATLLATVAAARTAYPDDVRVRWFAPALLASLTPFVFWTASGLENALYAFVLVAAVVLQLRELNDARRKPWSAVAIGAVALTRPEGVAFAAGFLVHRVVCGDRRARVFAWIALFSIIYAAFLASRLVVFGEWLPNTYYAKVDLYDRHLTKLLSYFRTEDRGMRYVLSSARPVWPLLLLAAAGLLSARYRRANLLLAIVIGGTTLYTIYVGGDFWPAGRFFTAILPLLAIAAQHALNRWSPRMPFAAACIAAVVTGAALNRSLAASAQLYVTNAGDALISLQGRLAHARRLQALAHALHVRHPLVLDADIGGPAVAGLPIVDLGGLADIHIARFHYYAPFFRSYIFEERRPAFVRTHATWTRSSGVTAFPEFREQYVAIRSSRDANGLHGEFVRRDLLHARGDSAAAPLRPPSFRQAVEDGRARRRREAERHDP
jgi:hypothetical protein